MLIGDLDLMRRKPPDGTGAPGLWRSKYGPGMKEVESNTEWEAERTDLREQIRLLEAALIEAKEVTPDPGLEELRAEYADKIREAEQELEESSEKWKQERRRLSEEIENLDAACRKARTEGRAAAVQEAELAARIREVEALAEARTQQASTEREQLQHSLEDMKALLTQQESKVERAELDAVREELLNRVAETEGARGQLQDEFAAARDAWEAERISLKAEVEQAEQNARTGAAHLEVELREKLTTEYEWKLKELQFRKEQLEQKLAESTSIPPSSTEAGPETSSDIATEVARIDAQITEVTAFIEDPNSPLSKVVRKNVERAELEAYRRGLRYIDSATRPRSD